MSAAEKLAYGPCHLPLSARVPPATPWPWLPWEHPPSWTRLCAPWARQLSYTQKAVICEPYDSAHQRTSHFDELPKDEPCSGFAGQLPQGGRCSRTDLPLSEPRRPAQRGQRGLSLLNSDLDQVQLDTMRYSDGVENRNTSTTRPDNDDVRMPWSR